MSGVFEKARSSVFLAPMAGVTDRAMRKICREFGAGLTYTEMISANGLLHGSSRTFELLELDGPSGVQLFGSDAASMADMAALVCEKLDGNLALIDINMGCPAPKIVKNGDGCALMLDLKKASGIISSVKKAINVPLTVKFRSGFDNEHKNALEFALMAEASGADGVAVHPRTRSQYYSGKADWTVIAQIKSKLNIPVIGNGDIFSASDAARMLELTGCDAVMVARGAIGRPFIFREIDAALSRRDCPPPAPAERIETAIKQLDLAIAFKGERRGVREFRSHASCYVSGFKNASALRFIINSAQTRGEMAAALERALKLI